MLYPKSKEPFDQKEFEQPSSEYRGAPFWAWNCHMDKEKIDHSVECLKDMGMGGGHVHCRTGMANDYMSDEFLDLVRYADEKFKKEGMFTYLYDEDRWPSGFGGGLVTKNHTYRIRFLVLSPWPLSGDTVDTGVKSSSGQAVRSSERTLLARYAVRLQGGYLADYRRLEDDENTPDGSDVWYAYLEVSGDNPWFNNEAYVNTLDPKAIEEFIHVTHERYKDAFADEFGKNMKTIFTDEPQFCRKTVLDDPEEKKEIILPFTDDLELSFTNAYGESLLAHLPEVIWELPDGQVSVTRYHYHDHIAERFSSAYADQLGDWCKKNGLALTGHMMDEPTLESQTIALGEAMRSYRAFDVPGIDMLCDRRELSTAKQAQSAVHQYGREGMTSELYGVTNWDFDFRGHKLQGDWQAALGVTLRVPHLFWTSMAGEAKRDYPASIGFQSPWYKEYTMLENYFARVNTLMTRGKAKVRVGVIHPVESYWLYWGNRKQTGAVRAQMDAQFEELIRILLFGLQDFDFISESLLPDLAAKQKDGKQLTVGEQAYDVILVPNCHTLRSTTVQILSEYADRGGDLVFVGRIPAYVDAVSSDKPQILADRSRFAAFDRESVLTALEEYRLFDVREKNGLRSDNLIGQIREEGEKNYVFLSHVEASPKRDVPTKEEVTVSFAGNWKVTEYDAMTGKVVPLYTEYADGVTKIHRELYDHDSLLLSLEKDNSFTLQDETEVADSVSCTLPLTGSFAYALEEENVLLLDRAEASLDGGAWTEAEEILRLDNRLRKLLHFPLRTEAYAQPWVTAKDHAKDVPHDLKLRFVIESELDLSGLTLALEEADRSQVTLNGVPAERPSGWYVDPALARVALPPVHKGRNELIVSLPYTTLTNVEAMMVLGDFGVSVEGDKAVLTMRREKLSCTDIVSQGLPFYGGNVSMKIPFALSKRQNAVLRINRFRCPLIGVSVDGQKAGRIAFAPYMLNLGILGAGEHMLELTLFGNRFNTFGDIHNADETWSWAGPDCWRTTGYAWSENYQLRSTGLLKEPELLLNDVE